MQNIYIYIEKVRETHKPATESKPYRTCYSLLNLQISWDKIIEK